MGRKRLARLAVSANLLTLLGCGPERRAYEPAFAQNSSQERVYSFAVHPLHNPALLYKTYRPLIEYLDAHSGGAKFKLIASRDYDSFARRLDAGEFAFALPNPYQAIEATQHNYSIFGKVSGDEGFRGLILTRRDKRPASVRELVGKTISYPAPTAVAATMLPQFYLQSHGLPVAQTRTVYVGSMESAIESVASGASDAAGLWPDPWQKYAEQHPEIARQLEVRWATPSLVNNALVVHRSVPPAVTRDVLKALEDLSSNPAGRMLLKRISVPGFEPADQRTYEPVRKFLANFSREVRPLEGFQ